MDSTFDFELRDAFVVRVEPLKKIHGLLCDRIGKVTITAECLDHVTRTFDDLAGLLKYENAKSKRVVNLRLSARSDDFKKTATIDFTDKWYFGGMRLRIEARDDVVTRLRSDLLDIVAGLRPWYFVLNKIDVILAAWLCYVAFWLAVALLVAIRGPSTSSESPATVACPNSTDLIVFVGSALYFGAAYLVYRFRRVIFPHGTFLLGQEQDRFDTRDKWRWGFVVAFVASFAAGLALLWFQ